MSKSEQKEILIIEDEPQLRALFADMLASWGYTHRSAENGRDGIRKFEQKANDVVLTDINMPDMDGLEALRRIKKLRPETEVIVVTGHGTLENAILAMKMGAADFVTKPVNFEHLKVIVNKCYTRALNLRENEALRESNTELAQLNRMKDRFISITNHEMLTPLTILHAYLETMNIPANAAADLHDNVKVIKRTVNDMVSMLRQMHNLSVIEGKQPQINNSTIVVDELFHTLRAEFKPIYQARNIAFSTLNNQPKASVITDRILLLRVLRELIRNALKYTRELGKVELSLISCDASQFIIAVSDTGIGIPIDQQEYIFDRFYEINDPSLHFSSNEEFQGGGLGIGLSIVKEVVATLKGNIYLESKPQDGSTFSVVLPQGKIAG
jgi:signal transduction histidine kinase